MKRIDGKTCCALRSIGSLTSLLRESKTQLQIVGNRATDFLFLFSRYLNMSRQPAGSAKVSLCFVRVDRILLHFSAVPVWVMEHFHVCEISFWAQVKSKRKKHFPEYRAVSDACLESLCCISGESCISNQHISVLISDLSQFALLRLGPGTM